MRKNPHCDGAQIAIELAWRLPSCTAMVAMRIHVLAGDSISPQARTYAEYRVFAALARSVERVQGARVVLQSLGRYGLCERIVCTVTLNLEPRGPLRIRTTGAHAYAAINRATERIRMAIESTAAERLSS